MFNHDLTTPTLLLLTCISVPVVLTDYRQHRIPNALVLAGIVSGLLLHVSAAGITGAMLSGSGMVIGLICLIPSYLARSIGAGDVKLMAAMGAILGPVAVLVAFVLTLILGSILALAAMANPESAVHEIPRSRRSLPYAAAICGGSLAAPLALGGLDALVPMVLF